ncbi:hypothetical protein MKW92_024474 [Papaver armeniacum]|nr:hypothetical protein MKW92_024474 [Papaver armeniacum]
MELQLLLVRTKKCNTNATPTPSAPASKGSIAASYTSAATFSILKISTQVTQLTITYLLEPF